MTLQQALQLCAQHNYRYRHEFSPSRNAEFAAIEGKHELAQALRQVVA